MRDFNPYHEQGLNGQSMGRWEDENRWQRRKEFDIYRWLRQFHVANSTCWRHKRKKGKYVQLKEDRSKEGLKERKRGREGIFLFHRYSIKSCVSEVIY